MHGGSSPLVRGARSNGRSHRPAFRIIPARAGSTCQMAGALNFYGDHPRSCGEHCVQTVPICQETGSSPLVRGAPRIAAAVGRKAGIIPARAGSTGWDARTRTARRDHPRSCGEHCHTLKQSSTVRGSSPLVRGALLQRRLGTQSPGIIPARAGSTPSFLPCPSVPRDHPRSCGEHWQTSYTSAMARGSSPLVRGAPARDSCIIDTGGIIPARAGSTAIPHVMQREAEDHPRSCGEHTHSPRRRRDF